MTDSTFTIIDLLDIKESLDAHWNVREKGNYEGRCAGCGEAVTQTDDMCQFCDTPVVWKHSRVWKQLYGRPSIAEQRLLSAPTDVLGRWLCAEAGVERFPNPHALRRWRSALARLDEHAIRGIVSYCAASLVRRSLGMRGLINFVLNTTDRRVRELPEEGFDEEDGELDVEIYGGEESD